MATHALLTLPAFAQAKGFAPDLLARYGVRADFDRIEVPFYDQHGNELPRFQVRYDLDGAWAWNRGEGAITPYGLNRPVAYDQMVVITEGASDCWALWSNGFAALGIPGATSTSCLHADQVGDVPEVVIVREPDTAGARFPARVGRRLRETGFQGRLSAVGLAPYKDPRDALIALQAGFPAFIRHVLESRAVLPDDRPRLLVPVAISTAALLETTAQIDYLIDGLLPVGGSMLLGAQKKVGKSVFELNLTLAVARGQQFLGRFACRSARVLYVGVDEPQTITKVRAAALGFRPDDQVAWVLDRRVPDDWKAWLRDLIVKEKPGLLVVDTLAKLLSITEINSYGEWNRKLAPLHALAEEFKLSWAGSAHNGKDSSGGANAVAGSMAITAGVDTIVIEQRMPGGVRLIETEQRFGIDLEPTILQMNEDTFALTLGDEVWLARIKAVAQKILFLMGDGRERKSTEIITDLRLRRADAFTALERLITEGLLIKPRPGAYQISPSVLTVGPFPYSSSERSEPPELGEPSEPQERSHACGYFIGPAGAAACERCGRPWSEHG